MFQSSKKVLCSVCFGNVSEKGQYECIKCNSIACSKCTISRMDPSAASVALELKVFNRRFCKNCVDLEDIEKTAAEFGLLSTDQITQALKPRRDMSAAELLEMITATNHWVCRSCGIYGTYRSPHEYFCGGAYFGWLIGATPTEGRTCCNCVKRVTGSDAGYFAWSCSQCKTRKSALASGKYAEAGFEVGMSKYPLQSSEGMQWLLTEADEQSGPVWMRHVPRLDVSGLQFVDVRSLFTAPLLEFQNLKCINISDNLIIERIPVEDLCSMGNLLELDCQNCPRLITPPPEIATQGGVAVMKFLRALVSDGEHNTSMVIFLIGDGESGKTSLFDALKSADGRARKIDRDNRTVGIDIAKWDLRSTDSIDFTVYDMAGQSIYKDTHTYFVGRRAIYLFIWRLVPSDNLSYELNSKLKEMVESWIDTLQFRIPGASVMAVATHVDCVTQEDREAQTEAVAEIIRNRVLSYSEGLPLRIWDHGNSILVNSLDGTGIESCRERIVQFSKSLPWYNEPLPKTWISLDISLQQLLASGEVYFLKWQEYCAIAKKAEIPPDMLISVTKFFHETGKIR